MFQLCSLSIAFMGAPVLADEAVTEGRAQAPNLAEPAPPTSNLTWTTSHLGLGVMDITPELRRHYGALDDAGVLVSDVREDSAADVAGLRVGDLLVEVNTHKIISRARYESVIRTQPAEFLQVAVMRNGELLILTPVFPQVRSRGRILIQLPQTPDRPRNDIEIQMPDLQREMDTIRTQMELLESRLEEFQRAIKVEIEGAQPSSPQPSSPQPSSPQPPPSQPVPPPQGATEGSRWDGTPSPVE